MKKFTEPFADSHPFLRVLHTLISEPGRNDAAPRARAMPHLRMAEGEPVPRRAATGAAAAFCEFAGMAATEPPAAAPVEREIRAEDIRRELGLRHSHSISDLRRIRKTFAAANHPDRTAGPMRRHAEQRMKLANSIIDSEIARRRSACA